MPRRQLPEIDERTCTRCGDCVAICPTECLSIDPLRGVLVAPAECISCEVCQVICPVGAIAMTVQDW